MDANVDRFGPEELRALVSPTGGPAVSIYTPTHRVNDEADADRLRFRSALERAKELLVRDHALEPGDADSLLEGLDALAESEEPWRHQADGLAVFRAPGVRREYRLAASVPELVVVGGSFHIRPLLRHLRMPDRYWVLALGRKDVRLFEGSAAGLAEVHPPRLPRTMKQALGHGFERDYALVIARKESAGRHGEHGRGGTKPVFHGHGVGTDDEEPERRRFYREVDAAVRDHVAGRRGPVVLAAVSEHHSRYREESGLENLTEEGIQASVRDWSPERLHREAWPLARRAMDREVDRTLEVWERAIHLGKGEPDLAATARQAAMGRVRMLLLEEGRRMWGTLDRDTGAIELLRDGGELAPAGAVELLDDLGEMVLARGGEVLEIPPGRMPAASGGVGILW